MNIKNKKSGLKKRLIFKRFFSALGPGLVTGAADDDPSGIATYSIAGAKFGTSLLWMAWITWPLMASVQMMCARIGMITEKGLAGALSQKFPKPLLAIISTALLLANIINIGADLNGMSDAIEVLTGVNSSLYVIIFGIGIGYAIIKFHYNQIANVLKWMTLSLFTYIIAAFLTNPDWLLILKQTLLISFPHNSDIWAMIVAILGTTISPYLFFWQASQEVEEERKSKRMKNMQENILKEKLLDRMIDISSGTFLSNIVMFFIILTTALTLNKVGLTNITSSREASEALRPLAGDFAMILFAFGIIVIGLLAIPTLAASAAYSFAETFNWKEGLDEKFKKAPAFYVIITLSIACGVLLDCFDINPMKALFWSAVVNGVLAPFLLAGILLIARDSKIMKSSPSSKLNQIMVFITMILMFAATIAMFII